MKTLKRWTLAATSSAVLTGCGAFGKSAQNLADSSLANVGCKTSQSKMWDSLNKIVEDGDSFPSAAELRTALLAAGSQNGFKGPAYDAYVTAFVNNYTLTVGGIQ